jgi:hypothetical protein
MKNKLEKLKHPPSDSPPKFVRGQVLGLTLKGKIVGVEIILDVFKGVYTVLTHYGDIIQIKTNTYDSWPISLVKPITKTEMILYGSQHKVAPLKGLRLVFKPDPIPDHTP